MLHHKRNRVSEINLTPLLDVLFSILFIVMLTGAEQQETVVNAQKRQAQDYEQRMEALQEKTTELETALAAREAQLSSYDAYKRDAIIVTITNIRQGEDLFLVFHRDNDAQELDKIKLGLDRLDILRKRIELQASELMEESANQPIYMVFYVDSSNIHTEEYQTIVDTMNAIQKETKEIFFKVMGG